MRKMVAKMMTMKTKKVHNRGTRKMGSVMVKSQAASTDDENGEMVPGMSEIRGKRARQ